MLTITHISRGAWPDLSNAQSSQQYRRRRNCQAHAYAGNKCALQQDYNSITYAHAYIHTSSSVYMSILLQIQCKLVRAMLQLEMSNDLDEMKARAVKSWVIDLIGSGSKVYVQQLRL